MGRPKTLPPLRSGGRLWGPHRIALGVSLRELQKRSGVSRGLLSMMESGRMVPTGDEFDRVMQALDGRPSESKDSII